MQARGFGARTFDALDVAAGQTLAQNLSVAPNLASKATGRDRLVTGGAKPRSTTPRPARGRPPKCSNAVVKLAKPATISKVQVSALHHVRFEGSALHAADHQRRRELEDAADRQGRLRLPDPAARWADVHYSTFTLPTPMKASYVRFWADSPHGETKTQRPVRRPAGLQQRPGDRCRRRPRRSDEPFTETFTIAGSNPSSDLTGAGVVGAELENAACAPPASQGTDGHVSVLKGEAGDGQHAFSIKPGATAVDADVYMYDEDCVQLGSYATSSPNEAGTIPSGTAYILTSLYAGGAAEITLTITDTQYPPPAVGPSLTQRFGSAASAAALDGMRATSSPLRRCLAQHQVAAVVPIRSREMCRPRPEPDSGSRPGPRWKSSETHGAGDAGTRSAHDDLDEPSTLALSTRTPLPRPWVWASSAASFEHRGEVVGGAPSTLVPGEDVRPEGRVARRAPTVLTTTSLDHEITGSSWCSGSTESLEVTHLAQRRRRGLAAGASPGLAVVPREADRGPGQADEAQGEERHGRQVGCAATRRGSRAADPRASRSSSPSRTGSRTLPVPHLKGGRGRGTGRARCP